MAAEFAKTIECLNAAFEEGAHCRLPKRVSPLIWQRERDFIDYYYLIPGTTFMEVSRLLGLDRTEGRRTLIHAVRHLRRNCSTELRNKLPISELNLIKPGDTMFLQRTTPNLMVLNDSQLFSS